MSSNRRRKTKLVQEDITIVSRKLRKDHGAEETQNDRLSTPQVVTGCFFSMKTIHCAETKKKEKK